MEETEQKRIQASYEKAIDAMRRYHSDVLIVAVACILISIIIKGSDSKK